MIVGEKLRNIVGNKHYFSVGFDKPVPMRIWLLPLDTRKNILMNTFLSGCKANPSFSYKLFLDADYLEADSKLS